jgi:hypothetical protein
MQNYKRSTSKNPEQKAVKDEKYGSSLNLMV